MGLREQKKKKTEARILSSLDALLARKSIEGIAMTDISALAKVSVGTLYNYFESRDDLIFVYARTRMRSYIARAQNASDLPPPSGEEALLAFLDAYLEGFCSIDRSVISHVMRVSMQRRIAEGKQDHYQAIATGQLRTLIEKLQGKGLLDPSQEPSAISLVLFSVFSDLVSQYSRDPSLDLRELRHRLRRYVGLVYQGLRRRTHTGGAKGTGRSRPGNSQEVSR